MSQARPSPIRRFLGDAAADGGPYALLGLVPGALEETSILDAMNARLGQVAAHAEATTPEADEVRLAIHASAAQLLDPIVGVQLARRWSGGTAPRPKTSAPRQPTASTANNRTRLEHDAVLAMAMFGGWNKRALRRLASLAHARGFASEDVASVLRSISIRRGAGARPSAPRAPSHPPATHAPSRLRAIAPEPILETIGEPPAINAPLRRASWIAAIALLVFTLGLGVIVISALNSRKPEPAPSPPEPAPPPPIQPAPPQPAPAPAAALPVREIDAASTARAILAAADALALDPDAAAVSYLAAIAPLSEGWTRLTADQRLATTNAVVEFVYRASSSPTRADRAVSAIAARVRDADQSLPASDIEPAAWAAGVFTRLQAERDLPVSSRAIIDVALTRSLGPWRSAADHAFEQGVAASIAAMPEAMASRPPEAEAWRAWMRCVDAVHGQDSPARSRAVMAGLEAILRRAEPNQDAVVFSITQELTSSLAWRQGDPARDLLLGWFADPRISVPDLAAVTGALATRSSASGIDLTMVLSTSDGEGRRTELRDRLRERWGSVTAPERAALALDWIAKADPLLQPLTRAPSPMRDIADALTLSRLSESATMAWAGHAGDAAALLLDLDGPSKKIIADADAAIEALAKRAASPAIASPTGPGSWGEKYLAAQKSTPRRAELLDRAPPLSDLTSLDADLLVEEAISGSPEDVRNRARAIVSRGGGSPAILGAMLELASRPGRIPRTAANQRLIEDLTLERLPPPRDSSWVIAARRALVERLTELLSAEGDSAFVDRLVARLGESYAARAGEAPIAVPGGSPSPGASIPSLASSARLMLARWESNADRTIAGSRPPFSRESVAARRAGRLRVARGPIQAFVADQNAVAELMAYTITLERPEQADACRGVLDDLADERARADHVFRQVLAGERAIARLWRLRLAEDGA